MPVLKSTSLRSLVVASAFVLASCNGLGPDPALDASVTADLRGVPPDARAIAFVSPIRTLTDLQTFAAGVHPQLQADLDSVRSRLDQLLQSAALDPTRDLESVVLGAADTHDAVAVARGTFDADAVIASLDAVLPDSTRRTLASGIVSWSVGGPHGNMAGAVIPPDRLVAASGEAELLAAIDRLQGSGRDVTMPIMDLVGAIADAPAWAIVRDIPTVSGMEFDPGDDRAPIMGLARAVLHVAVRGHIEGDLAVGSMVLWPREGIDPGDLEDLAGGVKAALLLQKDLPQAVRENIEAVDVSSERGRVHITGSISASMLRDLANH